MATISVGELRQNPAAALADVQRGQTYVVTQHRRPIAQLVPVPAPGPSGAEVMRAAEQWRREAAGSVASGAGFTQKWLAELRASVVLDDPWSR